MWNIQLAKLNFDTKEQDAVHEVIASQWLSMGEKTEEFETNFSLFLGGDVNALAVSSGTAALHMALLALEIEAGDEVIIPSLTFVADANVVKMVGAIPVLADATNLRDWNVSYESIARVITKKTKAVIVVHYAGYPVKDIHKISKLCKDHGIALIEDAAHSPGAGINGKLCGSFGDIGCFSFFSNKNLAVGEGGMVVSSDINLFKKLTHLRSHGMTSLTLDRHKGRTITYDVTMPGLNYRMDEIRAAIGCVQLDKLRAGNARRGELTERYRSNLKDSLALIPFGDQLLTVSSAYHILPVLLPENIDRKSVIEALKIKKIQSSIHYPPFWNFAGYKDCFSPNDSPITATICRRQLTLPLYPTMTFEEIDQVTETLIEAL
jgi:dTDP-4-amino-4,6-dideoxygalactose transaminase